MTRSATEVFRQSPTEAAKSLLGWTITSAGSSGVIVETEAYAEFGDDACHTFFKQTARDFVAKHDAGAVYIYLNYGVYWLLNFLTVSGQGDRGFVLVRALEPKSGIPLMHQRRTKTRQLKERELCSGPGKLTIALQINDDCHETYVGTNDCPFTLRAGKPNASVESGPRIGITKAAEYPWRFGLQGNPHLSRPL